MYKILKYVGRKFQLHYLKSKLFEKKIIIQSSTNVQLGLDLSFFMQNSF